MDMPSYAIEQLAQTLKNARLTQGMTQRELADRAGLGQSRLALIEAGRVDFRTSTLMQLARALDLELVLAPRKMLPAVQSLIGARLRRPEAGRDSARRTPLWALRHIQQHIAVLERAHPSSQELAQAKNAVQALIERGPDLGSSTLQPLRRSAHWLALARANDTQAQPLLAKAATQLKELRQLLPATGNPEQAPRAQRAAYSLEDEIS